MKVRVELEPGEIVEEAEMALEKALKAKVQSRKEYHNTERYADQAIEDFHKMIMDKHYKLIEGLVKEIKEEVHKDIRGY